LHKSSLKPPFSDTTSPDLGSTDCSAADVVCNSKKDKKQPLNQYPAAVEGSDEVKKQSHVLHSLHASNSLVSWLPCCCRCCCGAKHLSSNTPGQKPSEINMHDISSTLNEIQLCKSGQSTPYYKKPAAERRRPSPMLYYGLQQECYV
jgi:hypothetical protein